MVSGWQAQGTPLWLSTPQAPGTGEVMAFSHPMEVLFPFFSACREGLGLPRYAARAGRGGLHKVFTLAPFQPDPFCFSDGFSSLPSSLSALLPRSRAAPPSSAPPAEVPSPSCRALPRGQGSCWLAVLWGQGAARRSPKKLLFESRRGPSPTQECPASASRLHLRRAGRISEGLLPLLQGEKSCRHSLRAAAACQGTRKSAG